MPEAGALLVTVVASYALGPGIGELAATLGGNSAVYGIDHMTSHIICFAVLNSFEKNTYRKQPPCDCKKPVAGNRQTYGNHAKRGQQ